jgi:hypothetical protein
MTDWGDIWVSKSEGDMFSEAWAAMDSRTDLTDEERTILDWAERIWFVGGNFNPERHGCYQGLLDLCEKKHHVLERLLKPKGGGEMRIVPWRTPVYDDFPGNQWPKEKTKRMERDGLTPKDVRARRRCAVRDAYYKNHLTEAERVNVDQRARIGALEQKVADLEQNAVTAADAMHGLLDGLERMQSEIDRLTKMVNVVQVVPTGPVWLASDEVDVDVEQVH